MAIKVLGEPWLGIALILHLGTLAFAAASLAGRYWMNGITAHFGLWSYCYEHQTTTNQQQCYNVDDVDAINVDSVFRTVQVFMCVGFGVAFVVFLLILGLLFMLVGMDNRKHLLFGTVVAIFLQGTTFFIGSALFLSQKATYGEMETDWAHYLAWAACCSSFLCACVLVIHYALNRKVYEVDY